MKSTNIKYQFLLSKTSPQNTWKALAILIAGLVLTVVAVFYTYRNVEAQAKKEFASVCNEIKIKIVIRLHKHARFLRSSAAFFTRSDTVTRKEWKEFNERSKIEKDLPGIQGVGFSLIIPKNQLQQHIQNIRKEGFPDYAVRPAGDRAIYTAIIYLEPFSGRNLRAFGYDMFSEPIRRKAMELSRDDDVAMLSEKVILVQETKEDVQTGALMYVPVYRNGMPVNTLEQRRTAIKGWIYSPYRMNDLIQGIFGRWNLNSQESIHLQIYDDSLSVSSLLYDSQRNDTLNNNGSSSRMLTLPIEFNGKKWFLLFTQSGEQISYFQSKVIFVSVSGILISVLLFLLSASLFNTRYRAQQIAKQLTLELKDSEERLREVLENSLDASYKRNLQTNNYDYLSPVFTQISGYTLDELKTLPLETILGLIHPDDVAEVDRGIATTMTGSAGNSDQLEYRFRHKDGQYRWFHDRFTVVRDAQDQAIALIGSVSDITERKRADIKIKLKNEELIKLNAEKDKFFSIIAHDLRSPFNGFLGLTQIMAERLPGLTMDEIQHISVSMRNSATNLFRLLENLLEWARIQQGLISFDPKIVEMRLIADKSLTTILDSAKNKEIEIANNIADDLKVFVDNNMLQTVIRNLVSNAVKFTNRGGKIRLSAKAINDKVVEISINDTGIGMSSKMINGLFRLDVNTSRRGTEGETSTGLGLIICKDFIEKHGGEIWVESEVGKGSTFYFTLLIKLSNNYLSDWQ